MLLCMQITSPTYLPNYKKKKKLREMKKKTLMAIFCISYSKRRKNICRKIVEARNWDKLT